MPMRLTGMNSGLDTESIIAELVKAKSEKKVKLQKAQTTLSYKQDIWKTLNSKIYNLYSKTIEKLSYTTAYKQQKTSVSNDKIASVLTGKNAANGVQDLTVDSLAKSGYLTGAKLNGNYTGSTKLSEITGSGISAADEVSFAITTKGETYDIKLNGYSTINDVVSQLKSAGVNANFDEKNQRFFISASETGKDADFALTASTENGFKALSALGINVNDTSTQAQYQMYADLADPANAAKKQELIDADVAKRKAALEGQITAINKAIDAHQEKIDAFLKEKGYADENGVVDDAKLANLDNDYDALVAEKERLSVVPDGETEEEKKTREEALAKAEADIEAYDAYKTEKANQDLAKGDLAAAEAKLDADNDYANVKAEALAELDAKIAFAQDVVAGTAGGFTAGATRIEGEDAVITLNGAEFTSKNNTFEINGLTITAKALSNGETVTLTTDNDYDAVYDTIKDFFKEYNSLISEIDKRYNADMPRGFAPLSDEEKDTMSDKEIEKYEEKLKDGALRRDESLGAIRELLKNTMAKGFEVNGQMMYLSSFGINTMSYFEAGENEKGVYHIDGDADDSVTAGKKDVLKNMIANDPETVISFFTKLSQSLYTDLGKKMKSDDYSGYNKVYNDKQMQKEYDEYTRKIKEQEKKIAAYEEKYYKQFSAMEVALAKMQSKTNAIAGLLGSGGM